MTREEFKQHARAAIVKQAPELGVKLAELVIESDGMQRVFARWAKKRPHGIAAFVRRIRGRTGIDDQEREELERLVRDLVKKYR
jgi:hypothetical protein